MPSTAFEEPPTTADDKLTNGHVSIYGAVSSAADYTGAPQKQRRPILTLRAVMSAFTALIVLIVAAVTFSITYTQGFESSDRTGRKFTEALVTAARVQLEGTFAEPVLLQELFMRHTRAIDGLRLPTEDAADPSVDMFRSLDAVARNVLSAPYVIPSKFAIAITIWDDGSSTSARVGRHAANGSQYVDIFVGNAATLNATGGCCNTWKQNTFELPDMVSYPSPRPNVLPLGDSRIARYRSLRNLIAGTAFGLWMRPGYTEAVSPPASMLPCIAPLRNQTHLLGANILGISLAFIEAALRRLPGTSGTVFFALDLGSIVATTHDAPAVTITHSLTAAQADAAPLNCASSTFSAPPGTTNFTTACRTMLADAAFPAAREAATISELVSPPSDGSVVQQMLTSDGEHFYAAAAAIPNKFRNFPLTMLVLVPRDDVLGDVISSGRMAAGITAAVFVIASVLAFVVVNALLRPLTGVSQNMARTARLQDAAADESTSALREVHDLQVAFSGMNAAIRSFTRYVPRDVVKELLASGQLCEINMTPRWCSMLFVDIAGFTSMCERVPPDELSLLVAEYFGRMSVLVMDHGGTIDKYIGDCIMAIWGAPVSIGNQETRATLCALQLDRESRVDPLHSLFDSAGERLAVRVGVASGTVLAGNMGSQERMSYTVIGDDCNLAARCEALNKQFGTRVMIAEATALRLIPKVFALRLLHRIQVVGKQEPVGLYEVLGLDLTDGQESPALPPASGARTRRAVPERIQQALAEAEVVVGDAGGSESDQLGASTLSASKFSTVSGGAGYTKKGIAPCVKLVEQAAALDESALFPTVQALAFANAHTRAVGLYCGMQFEECVSLLEGAIAELPSGMTEGDPAAQRLLEQARDAIAIPPDRASFVASWKAVEK